MVDVIDNQVLEIKPFKLADVSIELDAARDKSLTHRAYMFSAMAKGESFVKNPLISEDCDATKAICQQLGVELLSREGGVGLKSPGIKGWKLGPHRFDFGNSGTTARLMLGLFASVDGLRATVDGDASLRSRPMARVTSPLSELGATFEFAGKSGFLPLSFVGKVLQAKALKASKASAQIKSSILLAALQIGGKTTILLPKGGRDHTERFLQAHGCKVSVEIIGDDEKIAVEGPFEVPPLDIEIPRDPSSAAFLWSLPLIHQCGRVVVKNVLSNPTRIGFLDQIKKMGADIRCSNAMGPKDGFMENVATYEVAAPKGQSLSPLNLKEADVPACIDEIPILAAIAAFADGVSRFEGLSELRVKESDRLTATIRLLEVAGVATRSGDDWLEIEGSPSQKGQKLKNFDPVGDHRLAMAAAVLGTRFGAMVRGPDCARVSFPGFFEILSQLG